MQENSGEGSKNPSVVSRSSGDDKPRNPYRFVIIGTYLTLCMITGMAGNPLTPIATTVMKTYGVTGDKVTLTTSVGQIANIIVAFPSVSVAMHRGLRFTVTVGALLIAIGLMMRALVNDSLYWVVAGQLLVGAGSPFYNSIQAKVVTEWFDQDERGIWLALNALTAPLGVMVGFVMPIFFVDSSPDVNSEDQKRNVMKYLLSEGIIGIVGFVMAAVLWKSKETKVEVTSTSADDLRSRETFILNDPKEGDIIDIWGQIKTCLSRGSLRAMFVMNGIGFGLVTTVGATITGVLGCFSYPEYYGPMLTVGVIMAGLVGSLVYSVKFLSFRHQGRNIFIIVGTTTVFSFLLSICTIYHMGFLTIMGVGMVFGIFSLSLSVVVMEEIIRRIHSKLLITATILSVMFSQLFSAILIYFTGFLLEAGNELYGSYIMMALSGLFTLLFFYCFIAEQRLIVDDKRKKKLKEQLIEQSESGSMNSSRKSSR